MASIVVIGGNGFIGSHLVDRLAAHGHRVRVFDRHPAVHVGPSAQEVDTFYGDFLERDTVARAVEGQEHVVHALSTTTPASAASDPQMDLRTNVAGTVQLLEACVEAGVSRVTFLSSGGAVYGEMSGQPHHEEDPVAPFSPYGIGKLTIERYLDFFTRSHGLPSVTLRISNPFGPRHSPRSAQGIIPIAMRSVRDGRPCIQLGDGGMVRDYLYVLDAVDTIARTIEGQPQHGVYNIGSGTGRSVKDVLEQISRVSGITPVIERRPTPPSFVKSSVLNVSRFEAEFGRIATTPFVIALEQTWDTIRAEPSPPVQ